MRSNHRSWHLFCMEAIKDRSIMISILWSRNGNLGVLNGSHLEVSFVEGIYVLIFRRRCRVARRLSATSPTAFQSADAQFGRLIPRIFTRFERYNASLDFHRREKLLEESRRPPIFRNSNVMLLLRYKMALCNLSIHEIENCMYLHVCLNWQVRIFFVLLKNWL